MRRNGVCPCGKPAIKWKWHGWVCSACDQIEKTDWVQAEIIHRDGSKFKHLLEFKEKISFHEYRVQLFNS